MWAELIIISVVFIYWIMEKPVKKKLESAKSSPELNSYNIPSTEYDMHINNVGILFLKN